MDNPSNLLIVDPKLVSSSRCSSVLLVVCGLDSSKTSSSDIIKLVGCGYTAASGLVGETACDLPVGECFAVSLVSNLISFTCRDACDCEEGVKLSTVAGWGNVVVVATSG